MSELVMYRLIDGSEVVAKEISKDETTIVIDDPVLLAYHQTEKGVSVGFAPFMPQCEGKITLMKVGITAVATPNEQMIREHTRIFSGIII